MALDEHSERDSIATACASDKSSVGASGSHTYLLVC